MSRSGVVADQLKSSTSPPLDSFVKELYARTGLNANEIHLNEKQRTREGLKY